VAYKKKVNMKNKILVVAVHPDDETLGCGGTLLRYKASGDEIHWLICTKIDENNDYFAIRENEIKQVFKFYNFDSIYSLGLKTMQVDEYGMSELVSKISKVINEVKPNIIYLPFKGDVHSDHRKIFEASYSCTKSFRYPFIKKIYLMETLSETEFAPSAKEDSFIPNSFVDIGEYIDKKIEIMKIFKSEVAEHPFPRSEKNIRALATLRGATCGCEYAEGFMLLKEIL
jgi:lmbE-like protein